MLPAALAEQAHEIIAATTADLAAGKPISTGVFPAAADQVTRARAFVRAHLADHPASDAMVLLASELATNTIRHTRSRFFALTIARITGNRLRIATIDEGQTGIPHLREVSTDAERGRGMAIVDLLATRWGIIRLPGAGSAVWFEMGTGE